jgi:hypothetical protein
MSDLTTKEALQERAQLVRIHEANCKIEYPTPEESSFRLAVMKRLGLELGLKEVRRVCIEPPANPQSTPVRRNRQPSQL